VGGQVKTTKVVDIEICETCGNETRPYKCNRCGKECCNRCSDTVRISVDLSHPVPQTPEYKRMDMWSSNNKRTHENKHANFCVPCSATLVKFLTENNFATEKVTNYAVAD
jgi:hypothetical protein